MRSKEDLPLAEMLAEFGVKAERRAAVSESDTGGRSAGKSAAAALGLKLRPGETAVAFVTAGGPAARAGLSAGDQLVALDGLKLTASNWPRQLLRRRPARASLLPHFP